jgi:hypothetical protein
MRGLLIASVLSWSSAQAISAPLTKSDRAELTSLSAKFTGGWRHNSRDEVMSLFAADAVFIPHDGVNLTSAKQRSRRSSFLPEEPLER